VTKYLGPRETEVISRLSYEKITIITKEQFDRIFGQTFLTRQIIYQLKKKGILKSITKGVYYYSPIEAGPAGSRINEFLIPPVLFPQGNYYVGYSTMYNYYGFTDQIFQTLYVLNRTVQKERVICGIPFKLVRITPERMYGTEKIAIKNSAVIVSDKERTLVDLIYFPEPVGGLKKAFEILKAQVDSQKIDVKKLIIYALLFPRISTRKRIGFALEQSGVSKQLLGPLLKSINKTSLVTLYDAKSRKGAINTKWKVIVDDTQ
jgi:predicted transcriptional regulator of viral defense system